MLIVCVRKAALMSRKSEGEGGARERERKRDREKKKGGECKVWGGYD